MFVFFFSKPLFRLLPSFFRSIYIAKKIICKLRVLGFWLRLFDSKVFYANALSLYLDRSNISKTIALLDLIVYFLDIKSRLGACFGFSLEYFFNHFFKCPILDLFILFGSL